MKKMMPEKLASEILSNEKQLGKTPLAFKNIILWRHADAAEFASDQALYDDMARPLTLKGQQQAKKVARWLTEHLPKNINCQCSPALRAFQTGLAINLKVNINPAFKPSANIQQVLNAMRNINQENILLIGHQPWLGLLLAELAGLANSDVSIKKGAIWWLRQVDAETERYQIISVQSPNLL
jgi:phosphohistidine phosphatase